MTNEETTMATDPQPDAISFRTRGSGARDDLDDFGASIIADRLYRNDGPTGRYWQGREQVRQGRVNTVVVDLIARYKYSTAYLSVVAFAAFLSEVAF